MGNKGAKKSSTELTDQRWFFSVPRKGEKHRDFFLVSEIKLLQANTQYTAQGLKTKEKKTFSRNFHFFSFRNSGMARGS